MSEKYKEIENVLTNLIPVKCPLLGPTIFVKNRHKFSWEKKYAPTLDNYGQSCFVRSDFLKMKCVCKTQMMPPPDHEKL
jgi:hypothetical protein